MRILAALALSLLATAAQAFTVTPSVLTESRCARSTSPAERYTTCSTNSDCGTQGLCVSGLLRNPYRGFHRKGGCTPDEGGGWSPTSTSSQVSFLNGQFNQGRTLAYGRISLQGFAGTDTISSSFLSTLNARLDEMPGTGVRAILRFRYDTGANISKARIKAHMTQILDVVEDHPDAVALLEAGFFGNFGEWHSWSSIDTSSTTAGDANVTELSDHIFAQLQSSSSMGSQIPVAFRYPDHMRMFMDRNPSTSLSDDPDSYITAAEAFNNTNRARTFHHNDCIGYNANDRGTYTQPTACPDSGVFHDCCNTNTNCDDRVFLRNQTDYSGTSGEACAYESASSIDCSNVLPQMVLNNWWEIEDCWDQGRISLNFWQSDGCMDEIAKYLGYYYILTSATFPNTIQSPGTASVSLTMRNDGFARAYHQRTMYIVLDSGTARRNIPLSADFRKLFAPGGGATGTLATITETITIPSGMPSGTYTVALWLPDFAPSLKHTSNGGTLSSLPDEVKYSVRLGNASIWNSTGGYHTLGTTTLGTVDACDTNAECEETPNEVCTTDTCNNPAAENSTCSRVNNTGSCTTQDGQFCNGTDTCVGGKCDGHTGNPCSGSTPTCNESSDTCTGSGDCTTNSDCNDGNGCTTDLCSGSSVLQQLPSGRIALSSDGNKHDCDDIFASAVSTALIAASGNASKVVYYGHSDHHWDSYGGENCNGNMSGAAREAALGQSTQGIMDLWGGFNSGIVHNCTQDSSGTTCDASCQACVDALETQIEASTSSNRLYIVAAGPMDIVGRAMNEAASGRGFVTLISHSTWNEDHSDNPDAGESPQHSGWTWNEMKAAFTTSTYIDLPDQNCCLNSVNWSFYDTAWNDSTDPRLNALWDQGQEARDTGSGGIDWPDFSDAGMVYWLLTGMSSTGNGSCSSTDKSGCAGAARRFSPQEAVDAFTGASCTNPNNTAVCSDGLFCNGADTCSGGGCNSHAGNPCAPDTCREVDDQCIVDECDSDGQCADTNVCTTNTCVNPDGADSICTQTNNTAACNDGLFCTLTDTCNGAGACVGSGAKCATGEVCLEATDECVVDECNTDGDCTDSNDCTTDTCTNAGASNSTCNNVNNTEACDDGLFCNGDDTCEMGSCGIHAGNPCPLATTCVELTDTCDSTGVDACDTNADCQEVPDEACTTDVCLNPALETSTCDRTNNTDACDDDLDCNGTDTCSGGTCSSHTGDPCGALECVEDWNSVEGTSCHEVGTPRIDEPRIVEYCTEVAGQDTRFNVTVGTQSNRGILLFAAFDGVGNPRCTAAASTPPTATLGGVAMDRKVYFGVEAVFPGYQLCYSFWYMDDPPVGTSEIAVHWPHSVSIAAAIVVPVYNVMTDDAKWFSAACGGDQIPTGGGADATMSSFSGNDLVFGFVASDKLVEHSDTNGSDITFPVQIANASCGQENIEPQIAIGVQLGEFDPDNHPQTEDFVFYDSRDITVLTQFVCDFMYVGNPLPFNTTTTTTTTLPANNPGGTQLKGVAKCKIK